MTEKIALIGAGSAMFTRGLVADLLRSGWDAELALVDPQPEALEIAERLAAKMIQAKKANVRLSASTDRRDVLPGATAVVCTVGVGGRRAWEQDVFIPRKYGIYQPVGDTCAPGGTSRALRMIPAMIAIAEDVLDLAPDALFFNYSNPMSPVCRGIRKATGAEVVGLCHGVFGVAHYLENALGIGRNTLDYTAIGINHFTWFTEIRANGSDAMPQMREIATRQIANGRDGHPFSWELFRIFDAFPAVLDRHVSEFFPQMLREGAYYGKTLGIGRDAFSFEDTIANGDRVFAEMKERALSPEPLGDDYFAQFGGEHEQVLEIIEAIRANRRVVYSVNLPNTGQVPNLPHEAVIESPAVVDGGGLRPLTQKPLPVGLAGTLATRFLWVETIVEAAIERSRRKFIQALVLDGSCDSLATATCLADELLAAPSVFLPPIGE
jgi:alpha-galactosidase